MGKQHRDSQCYPGPGTHQVLRGLGGRWSVPCCTGACGLKPITLPAFGRSQSGRNAAAWWPAPSPISRSICEIHHSFGMRLAGIKSRFRHVSRMDIRGDWHCLIGRFKVQKIKFYLKSYQTIPCFCFFHLKMIYHPRSTHLVEKCF